MLLPKGLAKHSGWHSLRPKDLATPTHSATGFPKPRVILIHWPTEKGTHWPKATAIPMRTDSHSETRSVIPRDWPTDFHSETPRDFRMPMRTDSPTPKQRETVIRSR